MAKKQPEPPGPDMRMVPGPWSDEDTDLLKAYYAKAKKTGTRIDMDELVRIFGRSVHAIKKKVGKLGIGNRMNAGRKPGGMTDEARAAMAVKRGQKPRSEISNGDRSEMARKRREASAERKAKADAAAKRGKE